MFEKATRLKMRFPYRGMVSVEDLWDLDVEELDTIFRTLNSEAKKAQEESLLTVRSTEDDILLTKIDIVKYIVGVKLAEAEDAVVAKERKEKKQKILELIAAKKDEELLNKSVEELQDMLNEI